MPHSTGWWCKRTRIHIRGHPIATTGGPHHHRGPSRGSGWHDHRLGHVRHGGRTHGSHGGALCWQRPLRGPVGHWRSTAGVCRPCSRVPPGPLMGDRHCHLDWLGRSGIGNSWAGHHHWRCCYWCRLGARHDHWGGWQLHRRWLLLLCSTSRWRCHWLCGAAWGDLLRRGSWWCRWWLLWLLGHFGLVRLGGVWWLWWWCSGVNHSWLVAAFPRNTTMILL